MNSNMEVGRHSIISATTVGSLFVVAMFCASAARAVEIETDNPDVKFRWDNTVKFSSSYRVMSPDKALTADVNTDDGDRNFKQGFVSNRVDLLSEMDASYRDVGISVSAAGWYDRAYDQSNDNNSPASANQVSRPYNQFTADAAKWMGKNAEILNGFAYGKTDIDGMLLSGRIGRHSLVWGETLFMGANGIAGGQQPVDLIKLLSVPSSQFKEIIRPVNQVSGQLQVTRDLSFGAYYQLEWRPTLITPAGSFLSDTDFVGIGSERLFVGPPGAAFWRGPDIDGKDSGQGGVEVKYSVPGQDLDLGLYYVRFNEKLPDLYLSPLIFPQLTPDGLRLGGLTNVYHNGIESFGFSASTVISDINFATEISGRHNMDLVSDPQVVAPFTTADGNHHPLYAIGDTLHVNFSATDLYGPNAIWDGGSLLAEIGYNERLDITKNPQALDPNTTHSALAVRFIFEPSYFQVLPGLDLTVPMGLGFNPAGRSSVLLNFNGGTEGGGDFSIGVKANYENVWKVGLSFTGFFGPKGNWITPVNALQMGQIPVVSNKQSLADRDFVSFSIERTF